MPITPLSSSSDTSGSSIPRTRTKGAMPMASAVLAIWPMVSRLNSECWQSMKMKSWPVALAMRAISPERPSRTGMPSETPPACMRSLTGLTSLSAAANSGAREFVAFRHVHVLPRIRHALHGADLVHESREGHGLLRHRGPDIVGIGNELDHLGLGAALFIRRHHVDFRRLALLLVDEVFGFRQRAIDCL